MLSFTQHQKNSIHDINQLDYEPLIISNKPLMVQPLQKNTQKKISKTITKDFGRQTSKSNSIKKHQSIPQPLIEHLGWKQGGKIQIFDGKIRKNQLAEEERRIRAEKKKQQNQAIGDIVKNQKHIRQRVINMQKQQQQEIDKLKRLIEKEREEKQKNDKIYEQKFREMEKERGQLIKLQRKIQEKGVKNQKEFKQQMNVLYKNEYPANDRGKCHQDQRILGQKPRQQLTQSEVNHQRNQLRQKQLQYLTSQRQKCMQNQLTLNYNPTIIPLLSRASYKIISTHISTLVELFLDDLLEQQVYLLQQIELKQQAQRQKERSKEIMNDYYKQLNDFVDKAEEIQNRVGRYHTMKFQDLYLPKQYSKYDKKPASLKYHEQHTCKLEGLEEEPTQEIISRKDRFHRFVGNFDEYKKNNLAMFEKVTQEVIDQAIQKLAKELDRGSNDFVELVFRKEFE